MKKILIVFAMIFLLVACEDSSGTNEIDEPETNNEEVETFTISYETNGGSELEDSIIESENQLNAPVNPTKEEMIFSGWYFDSDNNEKISWPIDVEEDTTIYAEWKTYQEYFNESKNSTITSDEFEYDFTLDVGVSFPIVEDINGVIDGNVKYNQNSDTPFYSHEVISGALLFDGERHSFLKDNNMATISFNDENELNGFDLEAKPDDFSYNYSMYAKVLFEYTEEQISNVQLVNEGSNKFEIEFTGGASNIVNTALGTIGNPIVTGLIGIPENDSDFSAYVNIENGKITSYEYDFIVESSGVTLSFNYDLDFIDNENDITISVPSFDGLSMTDSEIQSSSITIDSLLSDYLNKQYSEYNYNVKTGIDYPGTFTVIDSTTQGRTMRKVDGSDVYFWNLVDFRSDYENNDLYSETIEDYVSYIVMYENKDVYRVKDGYFSNEYERIENYDNHSVDEYYMFLPTDLIDSSNISLVQTSTNDDHTIHSVVLKDDAIKDFMEYIDETIVTDLSSENEMIIFNIESDYEILYSTLLIESDTNGIKGIEMQIEGTYNGSYPDTEFSGELEFNVNYSIDIIEPASEYPVPNEDSEVDLSNN